MNQRLPSNSCRDNPLYLELKYKDPYLQNWSTKLLHKCKSLLHQPLHKILDCFITEHQNRTSKQNNNHPYQIAKY